MNMMQTLGALVKFNSCQIKSGFVSVGEFAKAVSASHPTAQKYLTSMADQGLITYQEYDYRPNIRAKRYYLNQTVCVHALIQVARLCYADLRELPYQIPEWYKEELPIISE